MALPRWCLQSPTEGRWQERYCGLGRWLPFVGGTVVAHCPMTSIDHHIAKLTVGSSKEKNNALRALSKLAANADNQAGNPDTRTVELVVFYD